jgi:hypothetical protein
MDAGRAGEPCGWGNAAAVALQAHEVQSVFALRNGVIGPGSLGWPSPHVAFVVSPCATWSQHEGGLRSIIASAPTGSG